MADRTELLQEKAGLVKQQQEILNSANARIEELVKPIREETDAAITPLSTRVAAINAELLNALDTEAGINHSGEAEACPA
jgi:vacuolar-type H+-ATPase subunit H